MDFREPSGHPGGEYLSALYEHWANASGVLQPSLRREPGCSQRDCPQAIELGIDVDVALFNTPLCGLVDAADQIAEVGSGGEIGTDVLRVASDNLLRVHTNLRRGAVCARNLVVSVETKQVAEVQIERRLDPWHVHVVIEGPEVAAKRDQGRCRGGEERAEALLEQAVEDVDRAGRFLGDGPRLVLSQALSIELGQLTKLPERPEGRSQLGENRTKPHAPDACDLKRMPPASRPYSASTAMTVAIVPASARP